MTGVPTIQAESVMNTHSRYKSVKTIHTVNQGVSFARNLGLEQSSGEWIMFVDGDDVLVKNALNILYHQIQFYKYDLTRFGMYLFKNSKKIPFI